jgi:DNA repair exonuclease SbcCD ATPase subunit
MVTPLCDTAFTFFHVADIHIQNRRRDEYKEVFESFCESVRSQWKEPAAFVVPGDLFDSKDYFTPDNVADVIHFISLLMQIGHVIITPGNHDVNMNVQGKLDMLSAIVENTAFINTGLTSQLFYFRNSGVFDVTLPFHNLRPDGELSGGETNFEVNFHVVAIAPNEHLPEPVNPTNSILMFHEGAGSVTVGKKTRITCEYMEPFLACFGGHIHLRQQICDNAFFCGSLIQQNFGEHHLHHGYLVWHLTPETKCHPVVGEVDVPNNHGFVTRFISINGHDKTDRPIPSDPIFTRVIYDEGIQPELLDEVMLAFPRIRDVRCITELSMRQTIPTGDPSDSESNASNPDTAITANDAIGASISEIPLTATSASALSATMTTIAAPDVKALSLEAQLAFIQNVLTENSISKAMTQAIKQLHQERFCNLQAIRSEIRLVRLEFDNMYCFGSGNVVDFTQLENSLSGIVADNALGKSSIIDIIMFALFDETSRGGKREVLNQDFVGYRVQLIFTLNDQLGRIKKEGHLADSNTTTLPSRQLEFFLDGENLTGGTVVDTARVIQQYVGTYEDHVSTVISIQNQFNAPICNKPAVRKKALCHLLGFQEFEDVDNELAKQATSFKDSQRKLVFDETEFAAAQERIANIRPVCDELRAEKATMMETVSELERNCARLQLGIEQIQQDPEIEFSIDHLQRQIDSANERAKQNSFEVTDPIRTDIPAIRSTLQSIGEHKSGTLSALEAETLAQKCEFTAQSIVSISEELRTLTFQISNPHDQKLDDIQARVSVLQASTLRFTSDEKLISAINVGNHLILEQICARATSLMVKLSDPTIAFQTEAEMTKNQDELTSQKEKLLPHKRFITADATPLNRGDAESAMRQFVSSFRICTFDGTPVGDKIANPMDALDHLKLATAVSSVSESLRCLPYQAACDGCKQVKDFLEGNMRSSGELSDWQFKLTEIQQSLSTEKAMKVKSFEQSVRNKSSAFEERQKAEQLIPQLKLLAAACTERNAYQQLLIKVATARRDKITSTLLPTFHYLLRLAEEKIQLETELATLQTGLEIAQRVDEQSAKKLKYREMQNELRESKEKLTDMDRKMHRTVATIAADQQTIAHGNEVMASRQQLEWDSNVVTIYRKHVLAAGGGFRMWILNKMRSEIWRYVNQVLIDCNVDLQVDIDEEFQVRVNGFAVGMASGFQGFVASLAFRLAISKMAQVALIDGFVIDEGFSCLDQTNLHRVLEFLQRVTTQHRLLIVISHLAEFKNALEIPIPITVDDKGHSHIQNDEPEMPTIAQLSMIRRGKQAPARRQLFLSPPGTHTLVNQPTRFLCNFCHVKMTVGSQARHEATRKHRENVKAAENAPPVAAVPPPQLEVRMPAKAKKAK